MSDYYSFISKIFLDNEELIKEIEDSIKNEDKDYFSYSITKRGRYTIISGIIRVISLDVSDYIPLKYYKYFKVFNEKGYEIY